MSNSFEQVQDEILALLRSGVAQPVYESGIPDGTTVKRNKFGSVDPYITIQFGDTYASGGKSMIGQKGHDYSMPISVQVLSPSPEIGRRISNKILSLFLGASFDYAPGGIEKRPVGGAVMSINESDSASEVFMHPSWYRLTLQYAD